MSSEKGPWGNEQERPPIDARAERQMHVNRAISTIKGKLESRTTGTDVVFTTSERNTGGEHLTLEQVAGDIKKLLPFVQEIVDELNKEFRKQNYRIQTRIDYVGIDKKRGIEKPALVVVFD